MNLKRLVISVLAVYGWIFLYEWLFHGVILQPVYQQTASMWRKPEDCIFPALAGGQLLMGVFLCLLYARCCRTTGAGSGLVFGLLVGLFAGTSDLIVYAVQPLPAKLVLFWIVGGVIELSLAGMVLGAVYRPSESTGVDSSDGSNA